MQKSLQEQMQILMKQHPDLFPTEASFWAYLRGCLRRGLWEKSPMKFKSKSAKMIPPPDGYKGRGKKGAYCALTGEWTMTSKLEVDHKEGHKSLSAEEDVIPFIVHLLATGDELQMVDKQAHKIKSYAERQGITYEQAVIQKRAIEMCKDVKTCRKVLDKHSLPSHNAKVRREGTVSLLESGEIE